MTQDRFFSELSEQHKNQLPFVAYRKPNRSKVNALIMDDDSINDFTDESSGFIFSPFDTSEKAVFFPLERARQLSIEAFENIEKNSVLKDASSNEKHEKELHIRLIEKALNEISNQSLKKVVVSRKEELSVQIDFLKLYKRMLSAYPQAFVYCWYHPKIGLWMGATPETLLKIRGNKFKTMSLAGTQPYRENLDVAWGDKEKDEQQLVTDTIVNTVSQVSQNIELSGTTTIKAGSLLHLQTMISGELNKDKSNVIDLIRSLHPTPAVCGLPLDNAKKFILKNENYNREYYTGFLGELNIPQQKSRNRNRRNVENNAYQSRSVLSNIFVNLRCLKLEGTKATIFVGGGITSGSKPEFEWQETVHKASILKSLLY